MPQFIKSYVKRSKNDCRDAEVCQRPTMRSVAWESEVQLTQEQTPWPLDEDVVHGAPSSTGTPGTSPTHERLPRVPAECR